MRDADEGGGLIDASAGGDTYGTGVGSGETAREATEDCR